MTEIKFEDFKSLITKAVEEHLRTTPIQGEAGFTLIDGFIMQQLNKEISRDIIIGGDVNLLPLVAVVGNTSGRLYYFAVKKLNIPGLNI